MSYLVQEGRGVNGAFPPDLLQDNSLKQPHQESLHEGPAVMYIKHGPSFPFQSVTSNEREFSTGDLHPPPPPVVENYVDLKPMLFPPEEVSLATSSGATATFVGFDWPAPATSPAAFTVLSTYDYCAPSPQPSQYCVPSSESSPGEHFGLVDAASVPIWAGRAVVASLGSDSCSSPSSQDGEIQGSFAGLSNANLWDDVLGNYQGLVPSSSPSPRFPNTHGELPVRRVCSPLTYSGNTGNDDDQAREMPATSFSSVDGREGIQNAVMFGDDMHAQNYSCDVSLSGASDKENAVVQPGDVPVRAQPDGKHLTCSSCSMSFSYQSKLVRHMNVHHAGSKSTNMRTISESVGEPQSELEKSQTPGDSSERHSSGKEYVDSQPGAKRFICCTCSRSFSRVDNLRRHMKNVHTGARSLREPTHFSCSTCGKRYSRKSFLERHVATNSGHEPEGGTLVIRSFPGDRPFACSNCSKSFPRTDGLKRHTQTCKGLANSRVEISTN